MKSKYKKRRKNKKLAEETKKKKMRKTLHEELQDRDEKIANLQAEKDEKIVSFQATFMQKLSWNFHEFTFSIINYIFKSKIDFFFFIFYLF